MGRRSWNMRDHLFLLPLASLVSPLLCQLKFSGGVSSSSSNSNSNSPNRNTNNRPTDVDEKFFLGGDTPSLTGNQALDGGIVGLGLGALGAAVLGPTIQGALNGGQQSQGYSCGRRKRQANFGGQQPHCGNCCYNTQPFNNNNNGFNSNFQNQNFNNQNQGFNNQGFSNQNTGRCQCDYSLTFRDQNGNTHRACQRRDNTGRTWCYTTGWDNNCGDLQRSNRFQNNPWSYRACSNQG